MTTTVDAAATASNIQSLFLELNVTFQAPTVQISFPSIYFGISYLSSPLSTGPSFFDFWKLISVPDECNIGNNENGGDNKSSDMNVRLGVGIGIGLGIPLVAGAIVLYPVANSG